MTSDGDGARRRDVLRTGAGAGLLGLAGLAATDAFADRSTGTGATQSQRTSYAFSDSLRADDRFCVLFRPGDSTEVSTTRTIPADCLDDGDPREYWLYVVRAYRGQIRLGIRGLFVPGDSEGTETTGTTQVDQTTGTPGTTTGQRTPSNGTATGDETTPGNQTTENGGTTEVALQNATTTPGNEATTPENETTIPENGTVTGNGTATPGNETVTADGVQTTATPVDGAALPEIRVGEWYRVASSAECDGLFRLTLEAIDRPETTPADRR